MTPAERRRFIAEKTGKPVCDERNPFLTEDEDGEIALRCGLPKGHSGHHVDARDIMLRLGAQP